MKAEAECYMHPLAELTLGELSNRGTSNTNHKGELSSDSTGMMVGT